MPNKNNNSSQKTSGNAGTSQQASQSSSNTGSTTRQTQQSQHTSVQPVGQNQQGQVQGHVGGLQSATSAPGQQAQYQQPVRWAPSSTPGNPPGNYQATGSYQQQGNQQQGNQQQGNQQQGHGHGQAHYGGQYGQPAATQQVQGSSFGGNTAQQTQYPEQFRWRYASTPGNQQGAMGQGGSSSTSASGLGAGAHGSTMNVDNFRYHRGGGGPPNRGTRGTGRSRGQRG